MDRFLPEMALCEDPQAHIAENRWIIRYIVRSLHDARDSRACDDPKRNVINFDTE
jgi:hypothetical protein